MALGRVAGTARQDSERRVEPLEKPLGREQLRPRRGELDREWEAVEAAADLLHGHVGSDIAPDGPGSLDEECGRLLLRKRLEPVLVLPRHTERRSARDEHPYLGAGAEDLADDGSGGEEVLEVVEEEQELPPAEESREVVGGPDGLGDLRGQELGIRETRQRHPEDAVVELPDEFRRELESEPCLARAARARDGDEARPVREHRDELLELPLAADERDRDDRQVGCVERPEGRELALAELEEALGADQVLQAVLAEVADRSLCLEKAARRPGDDDLAAVRRGCDPRRAVDVHADVAFLGHERLAGVDAHPDPDRPGSERPLRLRRGGDGVGRP